SPPWRPTPPPPPPHTPGPGGGGAGAPPPPPLQAPLEILGAAVVELELQADRPVAMVAARLSDVAPDDKATRVTYGLLNLTHRDSSETPAPLEPGRRYRVQVKLNDVAQTFPAGHRIRLSLSTSYWPLAWPPPEPVRLTVLTGASRLHLPVRPPRNDDDARIVFQRPEGGPLSTEIRRLTPQRHNWRVIRDLAEDRSTLEVINDHGTVLLTALDLEMQRTALEWYSYQGDDFSSPRGETYSERGFRRGDWQVRTVTRTILTCSPTHFHIHAELDAYEGERRVYSRNWDTAIRRDLV
ncbi:MAG: peptidase S15, partial [Ectothiorhodospiraceae bacterium]|nr:peptidase S15 [Ectothiorhodospiraceae bacterium]